MSKTREIIDVCWDRVTAQDYIYVTQVITLIGELEQVLGIQAFFKQSELSTLEKTIANNPDVKVYKRKVEEFLLMMVSYSSFEKLLKDRFDIRLNDVKVSARSSQPTQDVKFHSTKPLGRSTLNTNALLSPPISPALKSEDLHSTTKELELEVQIKILNREKNALQTRNEAQLNRIRLLESEVLDLKLAKNDLEPRREVGDLSRKLHEKELTILKLQTLCNTYKYQANNEDYKKLIQGIDKQDELIRSLKEKLDLQSKKRPTANEKIKQFMIDLPFIKQYYLMYKYKTANENWGVLILNITALLLSALMFINVLKFLLYLFKSASSPGVYEYSIEETSPISITWWKEIEWLEYLVYSLSE